MSQSDSNEETIFEAARHLGEPDKQAAYLDLACGKDQALRQRIEQLLRAGQRAKEFFQKQGPALSFPQAVPAAPINEGAGSIIGRYKLLEQIGEGGCGVVYMAEQEEPVRRRVALKVIKLGMDTRQVIARFEAERQALALMDHPNIAKVLDAGATEAGRPYFVMELVRGIKITDYCDENRLSTEDRLKLFIQVCQALQHAHQKGIIHRDIKPSNILVADHDGVPVPKIIDFGIAKATTGQRLTDKTLFTAFEQFIGTPAYMSPEQAKLSGLDIDTRTDIYSAGVLLYELLTGKTPVEQDELLSAGLEELRRTLRDKEPLRPSTRLSTMHAGELTNTARHRHTDAPKLIHLLRGDLDWIVMKALEKDRARRYETASGLANDVQRHLNNEPVAARPPSKLYRFQKLVRRNKLAFAAAGAVAIALMLGLAASTWEYVKERKERQRATAVSDLLQQLLGSADQDGLKGADYTLRQLLDDFSPGLTNQLAGQPEVEAVVRFTMGLTYQRLGVLSAAEANLRRALDLQVKTLGPGHPDTLQTKHSLAFLLFTGQRQLEEGTKLAYEVWQDRRRVLGAENEATLTSEELFAGAVREQGHIQEAEASQRHILQIRERTLGPDHYVTLCARGNLGGTLESRGAWAEAEQLLQQSLKGFQRIGYADQRDGFICLKELALLRLLQGDPAGAEKLLEEVLPRATRKLGPDHPVTLHIQRVLGRAYAEEGQFHKAEAMCQQTLEARRRTKVNQDSIGTGYTQLYLGRALVELHKLDEAEPHLQEAMALLREEAAKPELAAQAADWLGVIQIGRKAYPEAEALMLPGSEAFFSTNVMMSLNERRRAVGHMVELYEAWNRPERAAQWKRKVELFDRQEAERKAAAAPKTPVE